MKRHLIPAVLLFFVLAACGNVEEVENPPSSDSSVGATQSATPSATASPSPTPSSQESKVPTTGTAGAETRPAGPTYPEEIAAPKEATTPAPAPADDGETSSLDEYLASGGVCFSDYFPAGPPTESAIAEIQNYCAIQTPEPNYGYLPGQDNEAELAECYALDPETASSGAIQYCYMEYGIDPGGSDREVDGAEIPAP